MTTARPTRVQVAQHRDTSHRLPSSGSSEQRPTGQAGLAGDRPGGGAPCLPLGDESRHPGSSGRQVGERRNRHLPADGHGA